MGPINQLISINGRPATKDEASTVLSSMNTGKERITIKFRQELNGIEVVTEAPIILLKGLNTDMRKATLINQREIFANLNISIHDVAKEGFLSAMNSANKDRIQCVACSGVLRAFDKNDIPSVEHRLHFNQCPMISGKIPSELQLLPDHVAPTDTMPYKPSIANTFIKHLMHPGRESKPTHSYTENYNVESDRYSMHAAKHMPPIDTPSMTTNKRPKTSTSDIDTNIQVSNKPSLEDEHGNDAKKFLQTRRMKILDGLEKSHIIDYIDELFAGNGGLPCGNESAINENMKSRLMEKCKGTRTEAVRGLLDLCAYRPTAALALSFFLIKDDTVTANLEFPEWLKELAKKFKR